MSSSGRHSLAWGCAERGPDQGKLWGCVALRDHGESKDWPRVNATSRSSAEREPKDGVVPSRDRRNSSRLGERRITVKTRRAEEVKRKTRGRGIYKRRKEDRSGKPEEQWRELTWRADSLRHHWPPHAQRQIRLEIGEVPVQH